MSREELHPERLSTTDEGGHRVFVHPEDVHGIWRNRRSILYTLLILVYFVLPWIHWDGKQIILLNLGAREFTFFGSTFYGHDAPLLFFVLVGFIVTFGILTTLYGRIWCGWGCPQTVMIDFIYRPIERFIEGKARARKKLDAAPWDLKKLGKKVLKWSLFLLVSLHLSHTFLGYFLGARELFQMSLHSPLDNLPSFITMLVVTAILLFDFGWFREQFCIIACPYGRIQSVIMDEHSLVVAYDEKRGEPRRSQEVKKEDEGDCINCFACVKVCPTGIDIRRGTQLECIACTQCIDACDNIMGKLGRDPGLIRYDSEVGLEGGVKKKWRARLGVYSLALVLLLGGFAYALNQRNKLSMQFIRGNKTAFQRINSEGKDLIVNHYKASLYYQGEKELKVSFQIRDPELKGKIQLVTPRKTLLVHQGKHTKANIFFKFEDQILDHRGNRKVKVGLYDNDKLLREEEVNLVGPIPQH